MQGNGHWRGLSCDLVILVAPAEKNWESMEVLAFKSTVLKRRFNEALKSLKESERSSHFELPVFLPLDKGSRKNVGHGVSNLKASALWIVRVAAAELKLKMTGSVPETFIDRVKREFAERNDVDVSKVVVEFRILT